MVRPWIAEGVDQARKRDRHMAGFTGTRSHGLWCHTLARMEESYQSAWKCPEPASPSSSQMMIATATMTQMIVRNGSGSGSKVRQYTTAMRTIRPISREIMPAYRVWMERWAGFEPALLPLDDLRKWLRGPDSNQTLRVAPTLYPLSYP